MEVNKRWNLLRVQVCKCVIKFCSLFELIFFFCSFTKSGMWTLFVYILFVFVTLKLQEQFLSYKCNSVQNSATIPANQRPLLTSQSCCCQLIIQTKEKTQLLLQRIHAHSKVCPSLGASPIWGPWMCHQLFPPLRLKLWFQLQSDPKVKHPSRWREPKTCRSVILLMFV